MQTPLIYLFLFLPAFVSGVIILSLKINVAKIQKLLLAYSGAFLLAICVLHLIPELYAKFNKNVGLFILLGFVLQLLLEFFSKGIEHGHFHINKNKLTTFPFAIFISLFLHAFIEGMALINVNNIATYNTALLFGIVIHKIPIAIVLSTMFIHKKSSKKTAIIALIVFALAAPFGLFFSKVIGQSFNHAASILLALTVGIFLHISTTILFETSEGHKFDLKKFIIILIGLSSALLTL